jgi:hypothetical protein
MDQFLIKLLAALKLVRVPAITIAVIISIMKLAYTGFIGDGDKRGMFSTILMLMAVVALLFYAEGLILWIQRITA